MTRIGRWLVGLTAAAVAAFVLLLAFGASPPKPPFAAASVSAAPAPAALVSPPTGTLSIPVVGVEARQLTSSWHAAREGGARVHEAIDIPAPGGTPVVAAFAGHVEKLFDSARGGTTAYVRSLDGRWTAYYAHLAGYAAGLAEGQAIARGAPIGFVGDSGDAGPGNTHLHFAMARMQPGERWWQGTPVDPYPALAGRR